MAVQEKYDLTGQKFGEWTVLEELGGGKVKCQCSCEAKTVKILYKKAVKEGKTKSCGCKRTQICSETKKENGTYKERHTKYKGCRFGQLTVVGKSEKEGKVLCTCDCSPDIVREFWISHLVDGTTKSCGHDRFVDLTGKQFGKWVVLEELGDSKVLVQCQCEDKTTKIIYKSSLLNGRSKSCGCERYKNTIQTMIDKYGDTCTLKIDRPRDDWQLNAVKNEENFKEFINKLGYTPDALDLSELLGINKASVHKYVRKYNAADLIKDCKGSSLMEDRLFLALKDRLDYRILRHCKDIINPYEIDIYIPELKIGVEFNGLYWHSDIYKSIDYHQKKSILCIQKGITLIHVFEHEWCTDESKVIQSILSTISSHTDAIAENTQIICKSTVDNKIIFRNETVLLLEGTISKNGNNFNIDYMNDRLNTDTLKCIIDCIDIDSVTYENNLNNGLDFRMASAGFKLKEILNPKPMYITDKYEIATQSNSETFTVYDSGSLILEFNREEN